MVNEEDPDTQDVYGDLEQGDVDLRPGANADPQSDVDKYISAEVRELYDVYSYRHAAAILANAFPVELSEIETALLNFRITKHDIGVPGGNESVMPKKFSRTLRPAGWVEARIQGSLLVQTQRFSEEQNADGKIVKVKLPPEPDVLLRNFIDGHKIDYVKRSVAFDLEWNSKDQTFDRDLYAMRAFHECGLVSVGVMVTRSEKLNPTFERIPQLDKQGREVKKSVRAKYGASTTWMGKLLYRLNAGRHGGCPVLVFGITPKLIEDWEE